MCILPRHIIVAMLLAASSTPAFSQNYIGMSPAQIAVSIKEENPHFKRDYDAVNTSYKYHKYIDRISEQTVLFFLSENNVCTRVRWMSDYSNLNDIIEKLNTKYKQAGTNTWTYTDDGESYEVKLEKEDWYFTVTIQGRGTRD